MDQCYSCGADVVDESGAYCEQCGCGPYCEDCMCPLQHNCSSIDDINQY